VNSLLDSRTRRKRKRKPFSFAHCRLKEIGRVVPLLDIEQTRKLLSEIAYTVWVKLTQSGRPFMDDELPLGIRAWFARVGADVFDADEIESAAEIAKRRPDSDRLADAYRMAELLDLKYEDRQQLKIFTIGAVDKTKRQRANARKRRKREQDRARKDAKRRERGAPSREQYRAESLSQTRPWEREGVGRRTWERRRERVATCSSPHTSMPSEQLATPGRAEPPQGWARGTASNDMTTHGG
jgi:hypothetical protein